MPSAALLAVTPPASPEEKRRKRSVAPPAIKDYGRGSYGTCSIPSDVLELADLVCGDRRIPTGSVLDLKYISRLKRGMRTVHAL